MLQWAMPRSGEEKSGTPVVVAWASSKLKGDVMLGAEGANGRPVHV